MENKIILAYPPTKGGAEAQRMLFSYLKIEYEEKNFDLSEWPKHALGLLQAGKEIPGLPYIIDGEFYLSDFLAIAKYTCSKAGREDLIGGDSIEDRARIDQILNNMRDIAKESIAAIYSPKYAELLPGITKADSRSSMYMLFLSKLLGENDFFINNTFSIADLIVAWACYMLTSAYRSAGVEDMIARHQNLIDLIKRVFALPGIREQVASEKFKRPIYTPGKVDWVTENLEEL